MGYRNRGSHRGLLRLAGTEARLAAQLDHPNVVQVYDVGEEAGCHYIVMQLLEGGSVLDLIRRGRRLEPEQALRITLQAARGLDAAHQCGMIHRDIKPSNLLLDSQRVVRIADFGVARALACDVHLTGHGAHMGTPACTSPEQWRGEEVGHRADVYALGVTCYHMLAGGLPFAGDAAVALMHQHLTEAVPLDVLTEVGCSRPVVRLVERMMAKDPAQRHTDAAELIQHIESILAASAPRAALRDALDDTVDLSVAEATVAVIRRPCAAFADAAAVWDAFSAWRGPGDAEYLRRLPIPDRSLVRSGAYAVEAVQASRGCPHACSYCSDSTFFGHRHRTRPVEAVVDEIKQLGRHLLFLDSNIIGSRSFAVDLFRAMAPLGKRWVSQCSIEIANDGELLTLAARSGCRGLFVGLETISQANLDGVHKRFNVADRYEEQVKRLHGKGITVLAGLMFGMDGDGEDVFERTRDFLFRARIDAINPFVVTPFPGTTVCDTLDAAGRIIARDPARKSAASAARGRRRGKA